MGKLDLMGDVSHEKYMMRVWQLQKDFKNQKVVTVQSVMKQTGYAKKTIVGWAKKGNVPLIDTETNKTVVPMTSENKPSWLK